MDILQKWYLEDRERERAIEEVDKRQPYSPAQIWELYTEEVMGPVVPYGAILRLEDKDFYDLMFLYVQQDSKKWDMSRGRGMVFSDYKWLLEVIFQVHWLYHKKEGTSEDFLARLNHYDTEQGIASIERSKCDGVLDFLQPFEVIKLHPHFPHNGIRGITSLVKYMSMTQLCFDLKSLKGDEALLIKVLDIYLRFFEDGKIQHTPPKYPSLLYIDKIKAYRQQLQEAAAAQEQAEKHLKDFAAFRESLLLTLSGSNGSIDQSAAQLFMGVGVVKKLGKIGVGAAVRELFSSTALNGTRQEALEALMSEGYVLAEGALDPQRALALRTKTKLAEDLSEAEFRYSSPEEKDRVSFLLRDGQWASLPILQALASIPVKPDTNIKALASKGKDLYVLGNVVSTLQEEARILRLDPELAYEDNDETTKKKIEVAKRLRGGQEKEVEEVLKPETILKSFEQQVSILKERGLLTERNDEYGIAAENGEWYPLPSIEDIQKKIETVKEDPTLREKVKQGFSELLVVPFGLSEKTMREALASSLQEHSESGTLKNILGETLQVHKKVQVEVPRDFDDEEEREEIFYYPKNLDMNAHGAMTKEEVIQMSKAGDFPGWKVLLVEDLPQVPSQYEGKIIADRLQIEGGKRPVDVLEMMKTIPTYQHEQGMTLEDWYMYALTNLDAKGYMIDDVMNDLGATKLLGVFRPASNGVLVAYWWNVRGKVEIYEIAPRTLHEQGGARNVLDLGGL